MTDYTGHTSWHVEMTRIEQLVAQQREYALDGKRATVNKITIEKLVLLSGIYNYKYN